MSPIGGLRGARRVVVTLLGLVGSLAGAPFTVDSQSNLFFSSLGTGGQPIGLGQGLYPIPIAVPDTPGFNTYLRVLDWNGLWSYDPDYPPGQNLGIEGLSEPAGPDRGTDLTGLNNIAGIVHANRIMFLAGVFLGSDLPSVTPERLSFTDATDEFYVLAPQLGQVFFIGDGRRDDGILQRFLVPEGAVALYLGVADGVNFHGVPGNYSDNSGAMNIEYDFFTDLPEPSAFWLAGGGLLGGFLLRRRFRKL
jgi:hypothetical protein